MSQQLDPDRMTQEDADILGGRLADTADDAPRTSAVLRRLTTAIATGEYLPGERLPPERELAKILGVGRVTVRTAIAQLVDVRLLSTKQGRKGGTFVTQPESPEAADAIEQALGEVWDRLMDLHDAEAWMHGVVAEAAAENRTDSDLETISERLEEFRSAASGPDKQHADELFHLAIVDSTHNEPLAEALDVIERQIHLGAPRHPWGAGSRWQDMETRALADHEALLAAIDAGDGPLARVTGRRHAGINRDHLDAALEDARNARVSSQA